MDYVQLSNDVLILHTSKGICNLNRYSFNFNLILDLLKQNASEEKILPLLKTPDTPNGVYFAYLHKKTDVLFLKHKLNGNENIIVLGNSKVSFTDDQNNHTFLGVYSSIEDVNRDWPEYVI